MQEDGYKNASVAPNSFAIVTERQCIKTEMNENHGHKF